MSDTPENAATEQGPFDPPCAITAVGSMCEGCGRLIQAHSVCPRSGLKPDGSSVAGFSGLAGMLKANVVVRGVLQKFEGDDTSRPPLETIEIADGQVVSHIVHGKEE